MCVDIGALNLFTGFGDLEFSLYAYIFALLSVISQSFYLTYIQKTGMEKGLSTVTVLYTNSVNCIPILLVFTLCNKELLAALRFDGYNITGFQVCHLYQACYTVYGAYHGVCRLHKRHVLLSVMSNKTTWVGEVMA